MDQEAKAFHHPDFRSLLPGNSARAAMEHPPPVWPERTGMSLLVGEPALGQTGVDRTTREADGEAVLPPVIESNLMTAAAGVV